MAWVCPASRRADRLHRGALPFISFWRAAIASSALTFAAAAAQPPAGHQPPITTVACRIARASCRS
jgi:hypothetical protein